MRQKYRVNDIARHNPLLLTINGTDHDHVTRDVTAKTAMYRYYWRDIYDLFDDKKRKKNYQYGQ